MTYVEVDPVKLVATANRVMDNEPRLLEAASGFGLVRTHGLPPEFAGRVASSAHEWSARCVAIAAKVGGAADEMLGRAVHAEIAAAIGAAVVVDGQIRYLPPDTKVPGDGSDFLHKLFTNLGDLKSLRDGAIDINRGALRTLGGAFADNFLAHPPAGITLHGHLPLDLALLTPEQLRRVILQRIHTHVGILKLTNKLNVARALRQRIDLLNRLHRGAPKWMRRIFGEKGAKLMGKLPGVNMALSTADELALGSSLPRALGRGAARTAGGTAGSAAVGAACEGVTGGLGTAICVGTSVGAYKQGDELGGKAFDGVFGKRKEPKPVKVPPPKPHLHLELYPHLTPEPTLTPPDPKDLEHYPKLTPEPVEPPLTLTHPDLGVSVPVPEGWSSAVDELGSAIVLAEPAPENPLAFRSSIAVDAGPLVDHDLHLALLARPLTDLIVLADEPDARLGALPARSLLIAYRQGIWSLTLRHWVADDGDRTIVCSGTCVSQRYAELEPVFASVAEGLSLPT